MSTEMEILTNNDIENLSKIPNTRKEIYEFLSTLIPKNKEMEFKELTNQENSVYLDIAKCWFYFKRKFKISCFYCNLEINLQDIPNNTDILGYHIEHSKNCKFIIRTNLLKANYNFNSFIFERRRLESFLNWPLDYIKQSDLANNGFYYVNFEDRVYCEFCTHGIYYFDPGDIPIQEHKKHSPNCRFLNGYVTENIPIKFTQLFSKIQYIHQKNLPPLKLNDIVPSNTPLIPRFSTFERRRRTFPPADNTEDIFKGNFPNLETLVEAGFFTDKNETCCFYCAGKIRTVSREDDPWIEHAKWFPTCSFLRVMKGDNFIKHCYYTLNNLNKKTFIKENEIYELTENDMKKILSLPMFERFKDFSTDEVLFYVIKKEILENGCIPLNRSHFFNLAERVCDISNTGKFILKKDVKKLVEKRYDPKKKIKPILKKKTSREKILENYTEIKNDDLNEFEMRILSNLRNNSLNDVCCICTEKGREIVFLPCTHIAFCKNCYLKLDQKKCPLCRKEIESLICLKYE
nr:baculoviral IAP repeat-containing protein 3-like [Cherax quadricarinatus]